MRNWGSVYSYARAVICALLVTPALAAAADIYVPAGGDLQAALNSAQAGDTILLQAGATFVGNFTLPVHAGTDFITVRSSAPDASLPPAGTRITPAYAAYLPKIRSATTVTAMTTAPGAAYWRLLDLEFQANYEGYGDILDLGDGSSSQYDLSQVPQHLVIDRVYLHGDPVNGQKRGIGLNSGDTTIVNSYISDIKAIGQDTQAIGGWNGAGPFLIENNYLEGAGENLLFGGDDPKITGLTPTGIVIRGNTLRKPVAWRDPIVPTPPPPVPIVTLGGSLAAGTYAYRVVAREPIAATTAKSLPSTEVTVTVSAGSRVSLAWTPVPGATDYVVYGRTPGAENVYWVVGSPAFVDDGSSGGTSGTPSSSATVWQVKNLLELKNASQVQIDHNLLENNWVQAQDGMALLITPRNQYGGCTWCGVQQVTIEHNVLRHSPGGITILGYDNEHTSQQTNHITIRNNELSDLSKSWGGGDYPFLILAGPRDITIDHNTVISTGNGFLEVSGPAVYDFTLTNNVALHNAYGIFGANYGYGTAAINVYFPGAVVTKNVLAGGSARDYPSGNLSPTVTDFQAHFVDYTNGNYALNTGTDWASAGTDGLDLGAAYPIFDTVAADAVSPLQLATTALPSTTLGDLYAATLTASGGVQPYGWSISGGTLPPGLTLNAVSGAIGGAATSAGDYAFTAHVSDASGAWSTQALAISVAAPIPPVQILTSTLPNAATAAPYAQSLVASGGSGAYRWSLSGGTLPSGFTLASAGVLSGTTPQAGAFTFSVTVSDAADATRSASASYVLTVTSPDVPPTVSVTAPANGAAVPVGATITLAAQASDADGTVQRVDFYVGGAFVGSSAGPTYTMSWTVPSSGSFSISAVATDNVGGSTTSAAIAIGTQSEIVIHAAQVATMVGSYALTKDRAAADGYVLGTRDHGAAPADVASASPANYAEFTFYAQAGVAYHLWVRGYAQKNSTSNDSAFVQFDGVSAAQIGTTSSFAVTLEDCSGCGVSGYGWQDNGWGAGVLGPDVSFTHTGVQTLRIQPREDGFYIDQIVLSPKKYLSTSPGRLKNDTTILPISSSTTTGSVQTSSTTSGGSLQPVSAPVPLWTSLDAGSVTPAGSASVDASGVYTVSGAGADIWNSADAFHFYYQTLSGDAQIIARVATVQDVAAWTKAAVMMRDTTAADSAHAMVLVSPGKGTAFQRRVATGGLSTHTAGPLVTAAYWVKLTRSGTTFTAYVSPNGSTWTQVGSDTISMGTVIDVGLAVTSHLDGSLATATFDHVTITQK